MIQQQHRLSVRSDGQGLTDITGEVAHWLAGQAITEGLLTLFLQHTSASLVIQENADPAVLEDLAAYFKRLVPEDPRLYRHSAEGPPRARTTCRPISRAR
jgi:secondary thiamine-phosphate synthase enzyme